MAGQVFDLKRADDFEGKGKPITIQNKVFVGPSDSSQPQCISKSACGEQRLGNETMLRLHRFFCCDEVGIRKVSIDEEHGSSPTVCPRLIDDEDSIRFCKRDVASSFPEESRLRRHLQLYLSFSSSATNQDILVKTLQWPLFSLGMYQLACQVSYARYVTRLFGFPAAVDAALNNSWKATSDIEVYNNLYKWLGKILAISMVLYYPMEHAAFFLWMQPTAAINDAGDMAPWWMDGNTWSCNSCRCWFIYVVADLTNCLIQLDELTQKRIQNDVAYKNRTNFASSTQASIIDRRLQLARNVTLLYPSMYWSMPHYYSLGSNTLVHPFLSSPNAVYALMVLEAFLHLYQSLRQYY